jgi:isoamylase
VTWHGLQPWRPDWSPTSRVIAFQCLAPVDKGLDVVYVAMNMHWERLNLELPPPPQGRTWHLFANTAQPAPGEICEPGQEPRLTDRGKLMLEGRSVIILTPGD